jgi:hypothetical protein
MRARHFGQHNSPQPSAREGVVFSAGLEHEQVSALSDTQVLELVAWARPTALSCLSSHGSMSGLARVIDPEQRALPRSDLIAQHQYPDVDLFQLRAEQEWD